MEINAAGSSSTPMDTDALTSNERENGSTQASSSSSSSQSGNNFNQVKRVCLHNLYGFYFRPWEIYALSSQQRKNEKFSTSIDALYCERNALPY